MLAAEAELALATGIEVDDPLDRRQAVVVGAVVEAVGHVLAEGGGEEAGYAILRAGGEERPVIVRQRPAAVADAVRGRCACPLAVASAPTSSRWLGNLSRSAPVAKKGLFEP